MMMVMGRLGCRGWRHPVMDLIVRAAEIVPYYPYFILFWGGGVFYVNEEPCGNHFLDTDKF